MTIWTRIDPSALYQPFVKKVEKLVEACDARSAIYLPTSGIRTYAEQDALYAQGRTAPGKIVTWAKGGESLHNHGIAVDLTRDTDAAAPGLQPTWDPAAYEILAEEAAKLGLESGLHWPVGKQDADHIQLPLERYSIDLSDLREMYAKGGYDAVSAFLDQFDWGA